MSVHRANMVIVAGPGHFFEQLILRIKPCTIFYKSGDYLLEIYEKTGNPGAGRYRIKWDQVRTIVNDFPALCR